MCVFERLLRRKSLRARDRAVYVEMHKMQQSFRVKPACVRWWNRRFEGSRGCCVGGLVERATSSEG